MISSFARIASTQSKINQAKDRQKVSYLSPEELGIDKSKLPVGYESVFDAIPSLKFEDSRSSLMKFSDSLGITNYIDKLRADAITQARTDYAQLLSNAREEEYNSPVQQVARQQVAGLNTDLNGNVSSGEAAEFNEPEQRYEYPALGLGDVASFIGSIPDVFSKTMALYSAFQGIKSAGIDIANKEIGSVGTNYDSLFKFLMDTLSEDDYNSILQGGFSTAFKDSTLDKLGIRSRSARKQANQMLSMMGNSFQRRIKAYDSYSKFDEARVNFNNRRSQPFFSENDNVMQNAMESLNKYLYDAQKEEALFRASLARRQKHFNDNRSGSLEASALNSQDKYHREFYNNRNGFLEANSMNAADRYQRDYYNSLDGSQVSSFDFAVKKYEANMAKYRQNLIDGLIKKGDPFSNLMAYQLLTGVNLAKDASDIMSQGSKLLPVPSKGKNLKK